MSAGRYRSTSGHREAPPARGTGGRTRSEAAAFATAFHDFELRKGIATRTKIPAPMYRVRKKRSRLSPGSWHTRFVTALEAHGDIQTAARLIGVPYGTARNGLHRSQDLRERCQRAAGARAMRMLRQLAKGQVTRWELSPRTAKVLLAAIKA